MRYHRRSASRARGRGDAPGGRARRARGGGGWQQTRAGEPGRDHRVRQYRDRPRGRCGRGDDLSARAGGGAGNAAASGWKRRLEQGGNMKWVTRERPKIDRVACPWLIRRFIDPEAEFLFVAASRVAEVARETGATPYDVE